MHGQCDARPTVTFPVAQRHRYRGTKLYSLVTGARGHEQIAQSSYVAAPRPAIKSLLIANPTLNPLRHHADPGYLIVLSSCWSCWMC